MENKINLKKRVPLLLLSMLCIVAVGFSIAVLIVHFSSKKRRIGMEVASAIEPKQVLKTVYHSANNYFLGDSVAMLNSLFTHCSKPLVQVFNRNPGIMEYTFARETRNGQLKMVDIVSQQYRGLDSAIVDARALYKDGTAKDFKQYFIKENGQWKLGLKYGHNIK